MYWSYYAYRYFIYFHSLDDGGHKSMSVFAVWICTRQPSRLYKNKYTNKSTPNSTHKMIRAKPSDGSRSQVLNRIPITSTSSFTLNCGFCIFKGWLCVSRSHATLHVHLCSRVCARKSTSTMPCSNRIIQGSRICAYRNISATSFGMDSNKIIFILLFKVGERNGREK